MVADESSSSFKVNVFGHSQGSYETAETATLIYNELVRHYHGTQLNKTPQLLNEVLPASRESQVWTQSYGVSVYHFDEIFIVVYDERVLCKHSTLEDAMIAAAGFVAFLWAEQT